MPAFRGTNTQFSTNKFIIVFGVADASFRAAGRDQWLTCMAETVDEQPFDPAFKIYLMEQLFVPAEGVRRRVAGQPKL